MTSVATVIQLDEWWAEGSEEILGWDLSQDENRLTLSTLSEMVETFLNSFNKYWGSTLLGAHILGKKAKVQTHRSQCTVSPEVA